MVCLTEEKRFQEIWLWLLYQHGRRLSNDADSAAHDLETNRNRSSRKELSCYSNSNRQATHHGTSRHSDPSNHSTRMNITDNERSPPGNRCNIYNKVTHVNLQTNNELAAALQTATDLIYPL